MPFSFGEIVNKISDSILKAPVINTAVKNPIYYALIIVFVIVLIIIHTFRDVESDESLLKLGLRAGVWIFIVLLVGIFLNNKVLHSELLEQNQQTKYAEIFDSVGGPTLEKAVPVVPRRGDDLYAGSPIPISATMPPQSSAAPDQDTITLSQIMT
jgi:hypothetical protein